ncbi:hypothetical protein GCM10023145_18740 [Angustibacter luteus]
MPDENGSVTPSVAAAATAASAALPPRRSTSIPTWVAVSSTDDTAPPPPVITGTFVAGCTVVGTVVAGPDPDVGRCPAFAADGASRPPVAASRAAPATKT